MNQRRSGQWHRSSTLPIEWLRHVPDCTSEQHGGEFNSAGPTMVALISRREADDVAARAFAKLPIKRRTELLAGKGVKAATV